MPKVFPKIIQIYNNERPHLSLNMLTPAVAHQLEARLKSVIKTITRHLAD